MGVIIIKKVLSFFTANGTKRSFTKFNLKEKLLHFMVSLFYT